jgi:endonuclease G
MKRLFAALLIVSCSFLASAAQDPPLPWASCSAQMPYGEPKDTKTNTAKICRTAYATEHDNVAKIPVWVSYTLTPEHSIGCIARSNAFAADISLPVGSRSELSDYIGNGYDQGHNANDADMSWDLKVEHESFLLSNMSPQLPALNRGIWKVLESNVRAWAYDRKHTLLIYVGPVYDITKDKTIGTNKVVVADAFYKIVVDTQTKETLAFIFPHKGAINADLKPFQTSVAEVEKQTGIVFSVPTIKTSITLIWPEDLASVAKEKKIECK